jgi:hypothetical protein
MRKKTSPIRAAAMIVPLMLIGCAYPAKFTGGGYLPSTSGGAKDKANFGFNMKNCSPETQDARGHLNFHDNKAPAWAALGGVKFGGFVVAGGVCTEDDTLDDNEVTACDPDNGAVPEGFCPQDQNYVGIDIAYESTNAKIPGDGTAIVCVQDNGQGTSATSDWMSILVLDGPYAGYTNTATAKGNLKQHTCTCKDGIDNDGDGLTDGDDPGCNLVNGVNGEETGA